MHQLQIGSSIRFMAKRNLKEAEIIAQESMRFDDEEERRRLNIVLQEVRSQTDGTVHKAHFFKALLGLKGYSLKNLTDKHRDFLSGEIATLHGAFPPISKGKKVKTGTD
jgi:hypothetical protein